MLTRALYRHGHSEIEATTGEILTQRLQGLQAWEGVNSSLLRVMQTLQTLQTFGELKK